MAPPPRHTASEIPNAEFAACLPKHAGENSALLAGVIAASDTGKVWDLFKELAADREHIRAVRDEFGAIVGIVTLEDVFETLLDRPYLQTYLLMTGDRRFIAPWTPLGGPVVSLPSGFGAGEMPIGMLLAGAPGYDRFMADVAPVLAQAVPQAD